VFAGDADGNIAPLRTLEGAATGLAGKVVTGIAESQRTGELYVLAKDAQFGAAGQVLVFGNSAQDNAAPVRAFTDAASQLADAAGIAFAYESVTGVPSARESGAAAQLALVPNPTAGRLDARLWLPRAAGAMKIEILDPAGRIVASLWQGDALAGPLTAAWDGRAGGRAAAPGVYVLRASGEGVELRRRFVVIR
jgi:hypothetical protein